MRSVGSSPKPMMLTLCWPYHLQFLTSLLTSNNTDVANLRHTLLHEFHVTPSAGHFGLKPTLARISASFTWPGLHSDTKRFIQHCNVCQHNKYLNLLVIRQYGLFVISSPSLRISSPSQAHTPHQTWPLVSRLKFAVYMAFPNQSSQIGTLCSWVPSGKSSFASKAQPWNTVPRTTQRPTTKPKSQTAAWKPIFAVLLVTILANGSNFYIWPNIGTILCSTLPFKCHRSRLSMAALPQHLQISSKATLPIWI